MVFSNVIVDVTISCHLFVFGQSRAKVSASFHQCRYDSLAVAPFDIFYYSLSVLQFVIVLDIYDVSEVPLMYGIVAVVKGAELTLV